MSTRYRRLGVTQRNRGRRTRRHRPAASSGRGQLSAAHASRAGPRTTTIRPVRLVRDDLTADFRFQLGQARRVFAADARQELGRLALEECVIARSRHALQPVMNPHQSRRQRRGQYQARPERQLDPQAQRLSPHEEHSPLHAAYE